MVIIERFKIKYKLLLLITLPIITLLMFSINHISDKYTASKAHEKLLVYLQLIEKSSNLIYELQIERGLSNSYLNDKTSQYFKEALKKQLRATDIRINNFSVDKTILLHTHTEFLTEANIYFKKLPFIREEVSKNKINSKVSFEYYTDFNALLVQLIHSIKLNSNNEYIYNNIELLQKLISLEELAGQERALISSALHVKQISLQNINQISFLMKEQEASYKLISTIFKNSDQASALKEIHQKYSTNNFHEIKQQVYNYSIKKEAILKALEIEFIHEQREAKISQLYSQLTDTNIAIKPQKWFQISSERINEIHQLQTNIFKNIKEEIENHQRELQASLVYQVLSTFISILILLVGSLYLSKSIRNSVKELDKGIKNFFEFLHFKRDLPEPINTNSQDEINDMAQNINTQMLLIQKNLEEDKDFIFEATQVVGMMKDGDFSEKPYFEPHNPNLIELKAVLNELIELISEKIKEQTRSLEILNTSLEDKVYRQTLALETQIEELTIARDKAIQAEISKDEFLANMSHEIRTPLNAILGFVSILQKRITDEKNKNYLSIVDTSGKSLLTIINDILDFSKIQSGQFQINPHPAMSIEEFSNAMLLFASKAYEKHLVYAVFIDPKLPRSINVDMVRIKQIISNVLSNAIKFTPEDGEIFVKVTYENSHLIISIKDSGIGIAKENQSKVFSAFEQADGSTTRKYGGTGLGLSISSKLAHLMNGTLTLESEEAKGSTFTLRLPIEVIDKTPTELINKKNFKNLRFALLSNCEACLVNINLIKQYLKDFGIENILELSKYQEEGYDILFFTPDDEYNLEVVEASVPAIAMLRTNTIKLADLEHIQGLYAPFVPKSIIQAINDTGIENIRAIQESKIIDEDEIQYNGSILVAEDNKTNQMLLGLILDDYAIDYIIANDGVEAVSIFKEGKFDMVLMDENMPNLNGIGAMKQIKAYEKEKSLMLTPIIALTASALDSDREMFLEMGMDGFVAKPINTTELEIEFNKYLKRK